MVPALQPVPKRATRQSLIDAAHALIWANSYAQVSVEDICRAAGVQKGSFYHFFPTKIDLAMAALEDHWEHVRPELDAIFAGNQTSVEQLSALCRAIRTKQQEALDSTGKVCGCPYATVGIELSSSSEALRQLSESLSTRFLSYFEKLLRHAAREKRIPAQGIKRRAREMHTYVIGAMQLARITNRLDSVGPALEAALFRMSGMEMPHASTANQKSSKPAMRLVKKR